MRYDLPSGLYYGQITLSVPYVDMYQVRVQGYDTIQAVGLTIGANERTGHRGGSIYPPGAHVIVLVPNEISQEASDVAAPAVIIGSVAAFPLVEVEGENPTHYTPNYMQRNSPVDINNNLLYNRILTDSDEPVMAQDRSFNRFMDGVPGDFNLATPLGGSIHLGDFMSRIGASPSAHVSCYYLKDVVEIVAKEFGIDTDTYTWQKHLRGDKFLIIEGMSLNTLEALGGYENAPPVTEETDNVDDSEEPYLALVEENQTPLLREQNFRGSDVDGEWKQTMAPQEPGTINTFDSAHIGLYSEKRRVDGIVRIEAAKEVAIRKTPVIRIAEPRADYNTTDRDPEAQLPEEAPPWEELGLTEEEYRAVYNIVADVGKEIEDLQIFTKGIRQDALSGIWLLETDVELLNKVFGDTGELTLPLLGDTEQEYPPDTVPSEEIEVTPERTIKVFKNTSAFVMEDEGGIILGDGWGSEIRLSRGNITISCPGDIKVQPGRDMQAKVPGNLIQQVGKRVEISSSTDSISIKAEENLHTLSGNGGSGSTIIENKASQENPNDITEETLLEGTAYGSGIVLKAQQQIAQYARNVYMGGIDTGDPSKSGTNGRCDVVMNAGRGGTIISQAGQQMHMAYNSAALTLVERISGLYVNSAGVTAATASAVNLCAGSVNMDGINAARTKIPRISRNDIGQDNVKSLNAGPPSLNLQGSLSVKGFGQFGSSIKVSGGGDFKQGANSQPNTNFLEPNIPASQAGTIGDQVAQTYVIPLQVVSNFVQQSGILTTYSQQVLSMAYPDSTSAIYRADEYILRNTPWQELMPDAPTWGEKPVKHDIVDETFPYPGKTAFEKDDNYVVTHKDGSQDKQKLETYKVNIQGLD
jgi:hypothetical protein